jgi:prevent-host-death family protein
MDSVGAYEAKTHLAELLARVRQGERFTITKHGVPVAVLQPTDPGQARELSDVIAEIRSFRRGRTLDGLSVRELIEEGRR